MPASPVARRAASALGVDLAAVHGTGPGGRVVRADVEAAVAREGEAAPAAAPVAAVAETARGAAEVTELSRLQKTVARRMAESRATVPDFELRVDVDMAAAVDLRERLKALEVDPLPSYNDMIVKAAALCLREFPRVNGAYRDGTIETYARVNVGIAVATDDALVVPTVTDADTRSLGGIARVTRELAAKVRDGSITPPSLPVERSPSPTWACSGSTPSALWSTPPSPRSSRSGRWPGAPSPGRTTRWSSTRR